MAGSLIRASEIATHTLGPYEFFRAVRSDLMLDRSDACPYWTWPQWDRFFSIAEQYGMTSVDEHNAGPRTVTTMHFKQLGHALLESWRRVRQAQDSGQSAYGFHMSEVHRLAGEKRRMEEMERYQAERRASDQAGVMQKPRRDVTY